MITLSHRVVKREGGSLIGVSVGVTLSCRHVAASQIVGNGIHTGIQSGAEIVADGAAAGESVSDKVCDGAAEIAHAERPARVLADGTAEGEHVAAAAAHIGERAPGGAERGRAADGDNLAEGYTHVDEAALAV